MEDGGYKSGAEAGNENFSAQDQIKTPETTYESRMQDNSKSLTEFLGIEINPNSSPGEINKALNHLGYAIITSQSLENMSEEEKEKYQSQYQFRTKCYDAIGKLSIDVYGMIFKSNLKDLSGKIDSLEKLTIAQETELYGSSNFRVEEAYVKVGETGTTLDLIAENYNQSNGGLYKRFMTIKEKEVQLARELSETMSKVKDYEVKLDELKEEVNNISGESNYQEMKEKRDTIFSNERSLSIERRNLGKKRLELIREQNARRRLKLKMDRLGQRINTNYQHVFNALERKYALQDLLDERNKGYVLGQGNLAIIGDLQEKVDKMGDLQIFMTYTTNILEDKIAQNFENMQVKQKGALDLQFSEVKAKSEKTSSQELSEIEDLISAATNEY